mmetsp:Transcript_15946/g.34509  ORF Transcript_15946/g.34509 Transcript_15946/m.34509 type:complete len:597 (-) Transcript_15946:118-1908(-)|eukprot:CAMPEP_0206421694 /NCGR_PEP_ID=MMETSP0324_2-20121206/1604_1 /ASSEMBLY_ACC=CAM_ASM_000836 /TAXON_ID=2866 /ORGANISM="Crypthecodinium cohnii, Strain Seligo" /LENGTH=596 /DNA_ID=CAMNT_0053885845 /DNA_START=72 /DNA_END=1862 /DNA_ORIENTATION=-
MALYGEEGDLGRFAHHLGLDLQAISFMATIPSHLRSTIIANFDPSGTKDGNVLGRLQGYAKVIMRKHGVQMDFGSSLPSNAPPPPRRDGRPFVQSEFSGAPDELAEQVTNWAQLLGLDDSTADFVKGLSPDLQHSIVTNFDASGTKDGNVWGRLLGYIRSMWARRLGLSEQAVAALRALPSDKQVSVIASFDANGSKDGNTSQRLLAYCQHLPPSSGSESATPRFASRWSAGEGSSEVVMENLISRHGLDGDAANYLRMLPVEVQSNLLAHFDPSGTKDGNVWGRLFAFARRLWAQHVGLDRAQVDQLKALPEHEQIRYMNNWSQLTSRGQPPNASAFAYHSVQHSTPSHHSGRRGTGGAAADATVADFVIRWGLDSQALEFMQSLPEPLQSQTLRSFDGSQSKDGNVWGRLFGYVRQSWAKMLGLDNDGLRFVKDLPEGAQIICITDFDPSGTKDGNVMGRLQGFAKKATKQASSRYGSTAPEYGGCAPRFSQHQPSFGGGGCGGGGLAQMPGESLISFCERCNLAQDSLQWLASLPQDIMSTVIAEFDPSGTKDGNVLGRLQGFVRLLNARAAQRKRLSEDGGHMPPAKRLRGL